MAERNDTAANHTVLSSGAGHYGAAAGASTDALGACGQAKLIYTGRLTRPNARWYDGNMSKQTHEIPTLRKVIEGALGAQLPPFPGPSFGVKNLDKVCAALLDLPAHVGKNAATAGTPEQGEKLSSIFADAVGRQLTGASIEKISAVVDGLVADYIEKRNRRTRVVEIAAQEITQSPPSTDTNALIDDDWLAFFKGKVDQLGSDEAKLLFGKVLAGEIKQPGSFSKRSIGILAEMGPVVGRLFDALCNISTVISKQHVRVVTLGMGDVGENSLEDFGLPFEALNHLIDAGLIFSEYDTFVGMPLAAVGQPFDLGGTYYRLDVTKTKENELQTDEKRTAALAAVPGVTLSATGRELRTIAAKKTVHAYVEKLAQGFAERGFDLRMA